MYGDEPTSHLHARGYEIDRRRSPSKISKCSAPSPSKEQSILNPHEYFNHAKKKKKHYQPDNNHPKHITINIKIYAYILPFGKKKDLWKSLRYLKYICINSNNEESKG